MSWTPRKCAHPGCDWDVPRPLSSGKPVQRCPVHAARHRRMQNSKHCRKWYATHEAPMRAANRERQCA